MLQLPRVCVQARAEVRAAVLDPSPVATGESMRLAGLSKETRLLHRASRVINGAHALSIKPIEVPRFRACHEEARPAARARLYRVSPQNQFDVNVPWGNGKLGNDIDACSACVQFAVRLLITWQRPRHGAQVVKLDHDFGSTFSGVLTDDAGRMRALWASYSEQVTILAAELC